jgi:hypothetical protein
MGRMARRLENGQSEIGNRKKTRGEHMAIWMMGGPWPARTTARMEAWARGGRERGHASRMADAEHGQSRGKICHLSR